MANPATVADIEARWRPLTDLETTNATAFLGDAWEELLTKRPNLEDDITAGTVTTANVVRVIVAMVLRIMRNPEGKRSESIDDYSYTRDPLTAAGIMHVTPAELALVSPGRRTRSSLRLVAHGDD